MIMETTYYAYPTHEFFITLGRLWFERLDDELWKFALGLSEWLYHLDAHPTPEWRQGLDRFLAEQRAEGREPTPESRSELEAFLANWASEAFPNDPLAVRLTARERVHGALLLELDDKLAQLPRLSRRTNRRANFLDKQPFAIFHRKLQEADLYLRELEQAIPPLARKLDAARLDEPVEVDDDLDRIEKLIWLHNDALEKAREAWLEGDLGSGAYDKLMLVSSPAAHGLPMFVDRQQAERAKAQWKQIGERLNQRIALFDKIIVTMQVLEAAGQVATALLGVGVLARAWIVGGKWVFAKTLAKAAVGGVISKGAGEAAAAGLRAVGVSEETIEGVQTAVEIISWLLVLRRINSKLPTSSAQATKLTPQPATPPKPALPNTPTQSPAQRGVPTSPQPQLSGNTIKQPAGDTIRIPSNAGDASPPPDVRILTPVKDPARPAYKRGHAGQVVQDHKLSREIARKQGKLPKALEPSNLDPKPFEMNARKGGYEGAYLRERAQLIKDGLSPEQADEVLEETLNWIVNDALPRPVNPRVLDQIPWPGSKN